MKKRNQCLSRKKIYVFFGSETKYKNQSNMLPIDKRKTSEKNVLCHLFSCALFEYIDFIYLRWYVSFLGDNSISVFLLLWFQTLSIYKNTLFLQFLLNWMILNIYYFLKQIIGKMFFIMKVGERSCKYKRIWFILIF